MTLTIKRKCKNYLGTTFPEIMSAKLKNSWKYCPKFKVTLNFSNSTVVKDEN